MNSIQTTETASFAGAEERFTLLIVGEAFKTIPQCDEQGKTLPWPLLARLHGHEKLDLDNPPDVLDPIDIANILGEPYISSRDRWVEGLIAEIIDTGKSCGVVVDVIESNSDSIVFRLRDAVEIALAGAIDISELAAKQGLPMQALLLRNGHVVSRLTAPEGSLIHLDDEHNAQDDDARVRYALAALIARFGGEQTTYFSLADFLKKTGDETPWLAGRSLYKYTDCGPSLGFLVPGFKDRGFIHYEDKEARLENQPWWSDCIGVQVSSIVEGSDAEVMPVTLTWPFTEEQFDNVVKDVNSEACRLWDEANGPVDADDEDEDAQD